MLRCVVAVLVLGLLAGCPAHTRLYIRNLSETTLVYSGWWKPDETVVIAAGRTRWVPVRPDGADCVELAADGRHQGYLVALAAHAHGTATGYGARIDAEYRDQRLVVVGPSGTRHELPRTADCTGARLPTASRDAAALPIRAP